MINNEQMNNGILGSYIMIPYNKMVAHHSDLIPRVSYHMCLKKEYIVKIMYFSERHAGYLAELPTFLEGHSGASEATRDNPSFKSLAIPRESTGYWWINKNNIMEYGNLIEKKDVESLKSIYYGL